MAESPGGGRTVLITGASRGIGRALAERLAAAGDTVIGTGRTAPDSFPGHFFEMDHADAASTAEGLKRILAAHAVDGLVNNAGIARGAALLDLDLETLELSFAVHVRASVQCAQAVIPGMKERGWGRIVNISTRAVQGRRERSAYVASKGGLDALTRTWALEFASDGITVNTIAPGPVRTELFLSNQPEGSEKYRAIEQALPTRRITEPDEVAAAIAFFLSPGASAVTGQTLHVCGGASIGTLPV